MGISHPLGWRDGWTVGERRLQMTRQSSWHKGLRHRTKPALLAHFPSAPWFPCLPLKSLTKLNLRVVWPSHGARVFVYLVAQPTGYATNFFVLYLYDNLLRYHIRDSRIHFVHWACKAMHLCFIIPICWESFNCRVAQYEKQGKYNILFWEKKSSKVVKGHSRLKNINLCWLRMMEKFNKIYIICWS